MEDNHHGDENMVELAHHQPIEKLTTPAVLCTEEIMCSMSKLTNWHSGQLHVPLNGMKIDDK